MSAPIDDSTSTSGRRCSNAVTAATSKIDDVIDESTAPSSPASNSTHTTRRSPSHRISTVAGPARWAWIWRSAGIGLAQTSRQTGPYDQTQTPEGEHVGAAVHAWLIGRAALDDLAEQRGDRLDRDAGRRPATPHPGDDALRGAQERRSA